ncbi:hypothetical protein B0H15DRAFT_975314 [Mycena belliarum]|uniref:Smr domain-containing protein n=1 Tax=Mycena belliarum TaxID=1033014 RepID=A0AAD6ULK7_9AGAR|nr:hypothetical protein B0H15DRAFT_975314 [Mycena belliae]
MIQNIVRVDLVMANLKDRLALLLLFSLMVLLGRLRVLLDTNAHLRIFARLLLSLQLLDRLLTDIALPLLLSCMVPLDRLRVLTDTNTHLRTFAHPLQPSLQLRALRGLFRIVQVDLVMTNLKDSLALPLLFSLMVLLCRLRVLLDTNAHLRIFARLLLSLQLLDRLLTDIALPLLLSCMVPLDRLRVLTDTNTHLRTFAHPLQLSLQLRALRGLFHIVQVDLVMTNLKDSLALPLLFSLMVLLGRLRVLLDTNAHLRIFARLLLSLQLLDWLLTDIALPLLLSCMVPLDRLRVLTDTNTHLRTFAHPLQLSLQLRALRGLFHIVRVDLVMANLKDSLALPLLFSLMVLMGRLRVLLDTNAHLRIFARLLLSLQLLDWLLTDIALPLLLSCMVPLDRLRVLTDTNTHLPPLREETPAEDAWAAFLRQASAEAVKRTEGASLQSHEPSLAARNARIIPPSSAPPREETPAWGDRPVWAALRKALAEVEAASEAEETPAEDDLPAWAALRQEASEAGTRMERAFLQSRAHRDAGNADEARRLSRKGKAHQRKMDGLNKKASELIFREKNKHRQPHEIDLHGLYVKEAELKVEKAILAGERRGDAVVRVIVGKGLHAASGTSKLGPAVTAYIER